jgi:hypothetical protein
MKNILAFCILLIFLSVSKVSAIDINLEFNTTFAPPHNEPVIGDKVARYRIQVTPSLQWGIVEFRLKSNWWGVNTWQHPSIVGHGYEAWENSDWSVEEWRWTGVSELSFNTSKRTAVYIESEYTEGFEGHQSYYHLVGFRWQLR